MTTESTLKPLSDWEFEQYVQAEVDGEATPEQLAVLEADRVSWRAALASLRRDADENLASARSLRRCMSVLLAQVVPISSGASPGGISRVTTCARVLPSGPTMPTPVATSIMIGSDQLRKPS